MLLQHYVTSLGSAPSVAQKNELLDQHCKLEARITAYEHQISIIIKHDEDGNQDIDPQSGEASHDMFDLYPNRWFTLEKERITLPSALASREIGRLSLQSIAKVEAKLHKGQVTDSLEGLRLALGGKAFCFCTGVRNANSQQTMHRAWDNVHNFDAKAHKCRSTYKRAWNALLRLSI